MKLSFVSTVALTALIGGVTLITTGCNPNGQAVILTTLKVLGVAADTALTAFSLYDPAAAPWVPAAENWIAIVETDLSATSAELAKGDTLAVEDTKIAEIWVNSALPELPGIPLVAEALIKAVQIGIDSFLGNMGMPGATAAIQAHAFVAPVLPGNIGQLIIKPTLRQRLELYRLRLHSEAMTKKAKLVAAKK